MHTSPSQKSVLSENFRYSLRPVRHSRVFRTDYGCVEKTFLHLIIMYWNFIWVIKYVLIKVACHFPMHLLLHGCMHIFLLRKTRKRCTIKMVGSTFNLEYLIFEDKVWVLECPTFQDVQDGGSNSHYKKNLAITKMHLAFT